MKEVRLQQLNLLDEKPQKSMPKNIEEQALELLVQLLIDVIPALEEGCHNEQNHR